MRLAIWLNRQPWFTRDYLAVGLVGDLGLQGSRLFQFLWKHHFMGYARWYDSEDELFSAEQMAPPGGCSSTTSFPWSGSSACSRRTSGPFSKWMFPRLSAATSRSRGVSRMPGAPGIDIDGPAIRKGTDYLKRHGSKVVLAQGDMEDLDRMLGSRTFDLVFAAGVLISTNRMPPAWCRASPDKQGAGFRGPGLHRPQQRPARSVRNLPNHEQQWIHNFAAMVSAAGGRVVRSRWEGAKLFNLQTIHFVFAVPG